MEVILNQKVSSMVDIEKLALLYRKHLVTSNQEEATFHFEGFPVFVKKYHSGNVSCTATIFHREGTKKEKTYYFSSVFQLNRWLEKIRQHNHMMFLLGYCNKPEDIPTALNAEFHYLTSLLDDVMKKKI